MSNFLDANFRIFSETLLAGILDQKYEAAIMDFRENHRGTLLGMTRFRDLLDDMPILGYGKSSLAHDRMYAFHNTLAGHSLNYLSRGTYMGAEQRQQLDYRQGNRTGIVGNRYRNDCGIGGEDCSLCMVSGIASAYWIRWMLVSHSQDRSVIYVARGAPRRWYQTTETWGLARAPTLYGLVTFEITSDAGGRVDGYVSVVPLPNDPTNVPRPLVSVHIRPPVPSRKDAPAPKISLTPISCAVLVAWYSANESAVFQLTSDRSAFNFTAVFHQG